MGPISVRFPTRSRRATTDQTRYGLEKQFAAVYGLLELNNETEPTSTRFGTALTEVLGEYTSNRPLYDAVLELLIDDGDMSRQVRDQNGVTLFLNARHWVAVGRALKTERVGEQINCYPARCGWRWPGFRSSDGRPLRSWRSTLPYWSSGAAIAVDNLEALRLSTNVVLEEKLFQAQTSRSRAWQLGLNVGVPRRRSFYPMCANLRIASRRRSA